jgi:hypothetical protein
MKVFSGECQLCDTGIPAGGNDADGKPLHTGDIVAVYHGSFIGTELEQWDLTRGLTAVVADQYDSYSNGTARLKDGEPHAYVMGIRVCGFDSPAWRIVLLKKFSDVVDGENWKDFGFNYRSEGKTLLAAHTEAK